MLSLTMGGAWKRVSGDFTEELRTAFKDKNPDQVHEILNGPLIANLGPRMVKAMGRKTRGILLNVQSRAQTYWRPHIRSALTTKAVSDYSGDYQQYIVASIDKQINAFLLAHPERILTPEIAAQLEYLKESDLTTSADVQGLLDRLGTVESQQDYFDGLSSTHVARLWMAEGIYQANDAGIATGVISGPDDIKTCRTCKYLIGNEISVSSMVDKFESDLSITDPDEYVKAFKFLRENDVDNTTRAEQSVLIEATGGPPFHVNCRHSITWLSH